MNKDTKLEQFLSEETDVQIVDATLKEWISAVMDDELREEMNDTLKNQYEFTGNSGQKPVLRYLRPFLAIAASIALLITLFVIDRNNIEPEKLAMNYLEGQTLQHPGSTKGISESNIYRTQGVLAFNQGDFQKAALEFGKIMDTNEEDNYYLGLAYLKTGQYRDAIEKLKITADKSSRFQQETNWFLALAYILDDKDTEAKYWLGQIGNDDWKFKQAQELLDIMNKK